MTLFHLFRTSALALAVASLSYLAGPMACAPPTNNPDGGTQQAIRSVMTEEGTYKVTYTPSNDPIPLSESFDMTVKVEYADGREITLPADLKVEADATMPAHNHGMNQQPVSTAESPGQHKVEGMNFHMPGRWVMTIKVMTSSGEETATFEIMM